MSGATIPLSKPLTAHGKEITELVLREPTSEDVMEFGYPFLIHAGDVIELRPRVVGQYVVKLAGVPLPTVKAMSIPDLQKCQGVVMGFFGRSEVGEKEQS